MLHWEVEVERQLNRDVTLGAGRPFFCAFSGRFLGFFRLWRTDEGRIDSGGSESAKTGGGRVFSGCVSGG